MIKIKTPQEIQAFKKANRLSTTVLLKAGAMVKPGVTTKQIDQFVENYIRLHGGRPGFKGYGGFPGSICASINDAVVHGFPSDRVLQEGDILSIDTGAHNKGWAGDNAFTFPVGKVSDEVMALLQVTRECLRRAIEQAVPGNRLGDIGHAVQSFAEKHGYGVIREFVGHGIGRDMHEDPNVPNYGSPGKGIKLVPGMVLAIEPMINMGTHRVYTESDGWTVRTEDGMPSAHFEKTVAITKDGPLILTDWDDEELLTELGLARDSFFAPL